MKSFLRSMALVVALVGSGAAAEAASRSGLAPDEIPGYVTGPTKFEQRTATPEHPGTSIDVLTGYSVEQLTIGQLVFPDPATGRLTQPWRAGTLSGLPIEGADSLYGASPVDPAHTWRYEVVIYAPALGATAARVSLQRPQALWWDTPITSPEVNLVENIARAMVAKAQGRSFTITDKSPAEYEQMQREYGQQMADFEARWALPDDALLGFDFRPRTPSINVDPNWSEETLRPYKTAAPWLFRHGHTAVTVEDGQMKLRESFWYQENNRGGRNIFLEIRHADSPSAAAGLLARWKGEIPRFYEATQGTWSGSTALTTGGLALAADEAFWAKPKDQAYAPFTTHYDLYFRKDNLAVHLGLEGLGDYRDDPGSRETLLELMARPEKELTAEERSERNRLRSEAYLGTKWFSYDASAVRSDTILGPGGVTDRQRYLLENIAMSLLANYYGLPYTITAGPATVLPSPLASSKTSLPSGSAFLLVCGSLLFWRRRNGARAAAFNYEPAWGRSSSSGSRGSRREKPEVRPFRGPRMRNTSTFSALPRTSISPTNSLSTKP